MSTLGSIKKSTLEHSENWWSLQTADLTLHVVNNGIF